MPKPEDALVYLSKKDPVLAGLFKRIKLEPLKRRNNHFESLVRSIISQQLSTAAARTILIRFRGLFGGKFPKPADVLKSSDVTLRNAGLSLQKITYIKALAKAVDRGEVNFRKLVKKSDEEIISILTKIKGIGRWTAEMFLIFSLNRPNIFSHGDLGLKNAIKKLYNFQPHPKHRKLKKLLDNWHPHKSTVSRYLWASLD